MPSIGGTFYFTPKARTCKRCNTDNFVVLVQLTNGTQIQKCSKCKCVV